MGWVGLWLFGESDASTQGASCSGLFSELVPAVAGFNTDLRGTTVFHLGLLTIDFWPRTGSMIRVGDPRIVMYGHD